MPRGRGDIDLLAIAPAGVFVIDAKALKGSVRINRPLFGKSQLMINGRDRTKLLAGLDRQLEAVRQVLGANGHAGITARGVLCFTQADLPLFGTLEMRGHQLLYRKALAERLNATGPLNPAAINSSLQYLLLHFLALNNRSQREPRISGVLLPSESRDQESKPLPRLALPLLSQ